jgi:hypothetical protein
VRICVRSFGAPVASRRLERRPNIWFTWVPESRTAKNRTHLDLRAPGAMEQVVPGRNGSAPPWRAATRTTSS